MNSWSPREGAGVNDNHDKTLHPCGSRGMEFLYRRVDSHKDLISCLSACLPRQITRGRENETGPSSAGE